MRCGPRRSSRSLSERVSVDVGVGLGRTRRGMVKPIIMLPFVMYKGLAKSAGVLEGIVHVCPRAREESTVPLVFTDIDELSVYRTVSAGAGPRGATYGGEGYGAEVLVDGRFEPATLEVKGGGGDGRETGHGKRGKDWSSIAGWADRFSRFFVMNAR